MFTMRVTLLDTVTHPMREDKPHRRSHIYADIHSEDPFTVDLSATNENGETIFRAEVSTDALEILVTTLKEMIYSHEKANRSNP